MVDMTDCTCMAVQLDANLAAETAFSMDCPAAELSADASVDRLVG